jgi:Arc/MetJ family transcription regulator
MAPGAAAAHPPVPHRQRRLTSVCISRMNIEIPDDKAADFVQILSIGLYEVAQASRAGAGDNGATDLAIEVLRALKSVDDD